MAFSVLAVVVFLAFTAVVIVAVVCTFVFSIVVVLRTADLSELRGVFARRGRR